MWYNVGMDKDEQKRLWKQRLDGFKEINERVRQERRSTPPGERLDQAEAMFLNKEPDEAARDEQERVWKLWQRFRERWLRSVTVETTGGSTH